MKALPLEFIISEWDQSSPGLLNEALTKAEAALDHCKLELRAGTPLSTNSIMVDREMLMDVVIDAINALDQIKHSYPIYSNIVNEYIVTRHILDGEGAQL